MYSLREILLRYDIVFLTVCACVHPPADNYVVFVRHTTESFYLLSMYRHAYSVYETYC